MKIYCKHHTIYLQKEKGMYRFNLALSAAKPVIRHTNKTNEIKILFIVLFSSMVASILSFPFLSLATLSIFKQKSTSTFSVRLFDGLFYRVMECFMFFGTQSLAKSLSLILMKKTLEERDAHHSKEPRYYSHHKQMS